MTSPTIPGPVGSSAYETWVLTLRAWARDPRTGTGHLPALTDESFTPQTYSRLLEHMEKAIAALMEAWQDQLQRALTRATTPHDMARELVALRPMLARRLELARHPGLPPQIREALEADATRAIRTIQRDLEKQVMRHAEGATIEVSHRERLLTVLRENSLEAVLTYSAAPGTMPAPAPLIVQPETLPEPRAPRWARRRLLQTDQPASRE